MPEKHDWHQGISNSSPNLLNWMQIYFLYTQASRKICTNLQSWVKGEVKVLHSKFESKTIQFQKGVDLPFVIIYRFEWSKWTNNRIYRLLKWELNWNTWTPVRSMYRKLFVQWPKKNPQLGDTMRCGFSDFQGASQWKPRLMSSMKYCSSCACRLPFMSSRTIQNFPF